MNDSANSATGDSGRVGRPVRILSLSFPPPKTIEEITELIDREAARGVDLVALPEVWRGEANGPERLDGPTVSAVSALARRHRTYIVCPIDRTENGHRFNSSVLIDRTGEVACVYDKAFPFWAEFDWEPPVEVGINVPVHEADFGRVGMAICFDVNFPEVWDALARRGAELVIWSSAYSAGMMLAARALEYHYYIATSTQTRDCQLFDITGRRILDESSPDVTAAHVTVDLDRSIYHYDFNVDKKQKLLAEHPEDIEEEQCLPRELWFVLQARRPGVSARALAAEYGLEELRDYVARSRRDINAMRSRPLGTGDSPDGGGASR